MISFFIQSLYRSFSMALVVMVYALAVLLFKRRYSAKSFYTTGTVILLGFLIPFRPHIIIPASAGMRTAEPTAAGAFLHRILTTPERGLISYTVCTTAEHTGYSPVAADITTLRFCRLHEKVSIEILITGKAKIHRQLSS